MAFFTAVTVLYKEPANFVGGNFTFSDYEITIPKQNNLVMLFPSVINHSVEPITMLQEGLENSERFSISQFLYISDLHP
jgi:predicted 2-oxoglutarate/Fe(II)-dependent dioxygenase YbiX